MPEDLNIIAVILAAAAGLSLGGLLGIALSYLAAQRRRRIARRIDSASMIWKR